VSARNLDALYIVARPGGEVVWTYGEGLDWQHEARMIPDGHPGALPPEESPQEKQTPEVLEHQRRQLEALGYVN